MSLNDDIYYYLLPFLKLKSLVNFSQSSSFFHQIVCRFLFSENKLLLLKFEKYSQLFFDQGSKFLDSIKNNYPKLLFVRKCLNSCVKYFPIVKKTLKKLRNVDFDNLFSNICIFLSNKKFNQYFLINMKDLVDFFPKWMNDEVYKQNEKHFLQQFPNYSQSDQCDEVCELIEVLSSSSRPLRKYQQLSNIEGIQWAATIQKTHLPELIATIYNKGVSLAQATKSLLGMKNNRSFYQMSQFSQSEMMTSYIGSVCLHQGYQNEYVMQQLCFQSNQVRFITTFFDINLVETRFKRLLDEKIENLSSSIVYYLLKMNEEQFDLFVKYKSIVLNEIYKFISMFYYLEPKLIENALNDQKFLDFIRTDMSYDKQICFLFSCLCESEFRLLEKDPMDHRISWRGEERTFKKLFQRCLDQQTNRYFNLIPE